MSLVALFWVFARWRRPEWLEHRRFLSVLVLCTPFGILALEAGWTVTEVGRQPWVIYHVLKTADAVTPVPGLGVTFAVLAALYLCLGTLSFGLLGRLIRGEMMRPHDIPPDGRSPAGGSSQGSTARTASKESA